MSPGRKLRLVHVTMEFAPWAKVGGLADAVSGLCLALAERGHDVTVILPDYGSDAVGMLRETLPNSSFTIPMGSDRRTQSVATVAGTPSGLRVLLLQDPLFRSRGGLYMDPRTGAGFQDEAYRTVAFARGVLGLLGHVDLRPDVIHLHDHSAAPVASILKRSHCETGFLGGTPTVLTLHNLRHQGVVDPDMVSLAGIRAGDAAFPGGDLEFYGRLNWLKAGLIDADRVTTVSPTYAKEIMEEPAGEGLAGVIRERGDVLGVLGCVDTVVWNPERDPYLARPYGRKDVIEGKQANRVALAQRTGLDLASGRPLIGIISRLVEQKGMDLLQMAQAPLETLDARWIILGSGEARYETLFRDWAKANPGKVVYDPGYDEPLAHLIQAGADMLLVPSRFEPCGLTQLVAQRYGTVPVVRATGGLADTVTPVDPGSDDGTGFLFTSYEGGALVRAIADAVSLYEDRPRWEKIMRRGMETDVSWVRSIEAYLDIYGQCLAPSTNSPETGSSRSARTGVTIRGKA